MYEDHVIATIDILIVIYKLLLETVVLGFISMAYSFAHNQPHMCDDHFHYTMFVH